MAVLKKVGVLSMAKLEAILMAIFGLVYGIFFAAVGTIASYVAGSTAVAGLFAGFGILSIVIFPVLFAIFGFISGAIGAFLYNLIAGWIGGIEMEFDK